LAALLWSPGAFGEPAPGTHRIGYLNPGSAALAPIRLEPLRQGLRELGYVEGRPAPWLLAKRKKPPPGSA